MTSAEGATFSRTMAARLTPAELDAHVDGLCVEHGIERLNGGRGGRAFRRGPAGRRRSCIRIAPVKSQITYAVALHEIGHLVGSGRSGTRLEKEAAAWRWALEHFIVELSGATRRRAGKYLRSYVTWAEQRQHRKTPPRIPPPASSFWLLLAELEA
ncbi:MAG: hypothetical protein ACRDLA_03980 [Thermoleophilaceae bacterium]